MGAENLNEYSEKMKKSTYKFIGLQIKNANEVYFSKETSFTLRRTPCFFVLDQYPFCFFFR